MDKVNSMNDTLGGAFVQTDSGGRPRALAFAPGAGAPSPVQRRQPRASPLRPAAARATPSPGTRAAPPTSSPAGRQRAASQRSQLQTSPSTSSAARRRNEMAEAAGGSAAAASRRPRAAGSKTAAKPVARKHRGRGPVKPPPGWVAANPGRGSFRSLPVDERCAAVEKYKAARATAPPKPKGGAGKKAKETAHAAAMTRKLDLLFRAAAGEEAPQGEAPDPEAAAAAPERTQQQQQGGGIGHLRRAAAAQRQPFISALPPRGRRASGRRGESATSPTGENDHDSDSDNSDSDNDSESRCVRPLDCLYCGFSLCL